MPRVYPCPTAVGNTTTAAEGTSDLTIAHCAAVSVTEAVLLCPSPMDHASRSAAWLALCSGLAGLAGFACVSAVAGCATMTGEARPGGTVRVVEGTRVVGRYISPNAYEHYIRAELAGSSGRSEEAALELARAITSDGTSAFLRTRLAEELLALGRIDDARESCETALRFDPQYADARVLLGRVALRHGDPAKAEAEFRLALDADRTCESAYLALAQLYRERGDGGRADGVLRSLVHRSPASAEPHVLLARSAVARGDLKDAEVELRLAARIDSSSLVTRIELGRVLLSAGRASEAEHELRRALERFGPEPRIAELLVQVLVAMDRGAEADALVESFDKQAASRDRRLSVGWLLLGRGHVERAAAIASEVLAGGELPGGRLLRGAALAAARRVDEAVLELLRVPIESGDFVAAQLRLGRALGDAGRLKEGIDRLTISSARVQDGDGSALLSTLLAELRERAGDRAGARHLIEEALARQPKSDALTYALGGLLDRAGEADRAVEVVSAILARTPDHAEALNFIGWSWTDRGVRLRDAQRYLERAHALRPTSGEIADSLGWLYFKVERVEDATRLLELASRLLPSAPDVLAHLGDAYLKRDDRPRAVGAYRRALGSNPDARVRQVVEDKLLHLEEGRVGAR